MKKNLQILFLTLLSSLLLISTSISYAQSKEATANVSIVIKENGFKGQYLIALYTISKKSVLGFESKNISIERIKARISQKIESNTILLPSLEIEREPNFQTYNNLILIISQTPDFIWQNADSSVPAGQPQYVNPLQIESPLWIKVVPRTKLQSNTSVTLP